MRGRLGANAHNPVAVQGSGELPLAMAYRTFQAPEEANAVCSAVVGREPTDESFRCGNAFVATMARP